MQKQPPPLVPARLLSTSDGHTRWREAALDVYLGHPPPTAEEGNDDAADPLFANSSHDEIETALISWGIQEPKVGPASASAGAVAGVCCGELGHKQRASPRAGERSRSLAFHVNFLPP